MDGQGEAASVSLCVSESTVSVTVPRGEESLMENLGSEAHVEEGAYSEGEGGEIMVEVVGADVFVDGIGGRDEGLGEEGLGKEMDVESFRNEHDFGARQVERDECGSEMEKVELVSELAGEQTHVFAVEKVEAEVSEEMVEGRVAEKHILRDAKPNEGCDSIHGGLAVKTDEHDLEIEKVEAVSELAGEQTHVSAMEKVEAEVSEEIVEGRVAERHVLRDPESNDGCESVHGGLAVKKVGGSDDEVSNPGNESAGASSSLMTESICVNTSYNGEKAAVAVKDEVSYGRVEALHDGVADASLPSLGEDQGLVIKTVSEATEKDSRNHTTVESSNNPPAADASMGVETVNEEEILQSDNARMPDDVNQDTGSSGIHEDVEGAAGCCSATTESIEYDQFSSSHPVVVTLQPVNQVSKGVQHLGAEAGQLFAPNQTSSCIEDQELIVKAEVKSKNDIVACPESEIPRYRSQLIDEKVMTSVDSKDSSNIREDALSDNNDNGVNVETTLKGVDFQVASRDSSLEPTVIAERRENMAADVEGLLDIKDKTPAIDTPYNNLSCSQNDKDMKVVKLDESSENVMAQMYIIPDGESTPAAHGGTATFLDKDEVIKFEVETDFKDSHAIATNIKYDAINKLISSEKDLLDADTGISAGHPLIAEGKSEVMDESHEEKLSPQNFSGLMEKEGLEAAPAVPLGKHIDTETPKGTQAEEDRNSKVSTCDTSHDTNISPLANEENLKGEIMGVSIVERDVVGRDSALVAKAQTCSTTCPGANSVIGEQYLDTKKQVVLEQQAEAALVQVMETGESKDLLIRTDAALVPNFDATAEGNFVSCSPEVNIHVSSNDVSPQGGDRSLEDPTSGVVNTNEPTNKFCEAVDESCKTNAEHIVHVDAAEAESRDVKQVIEVDKIYPGFNKSNNSGEGIGIDEHSPETDHSKILNDETIKPGSSFKLYQSGYLVPPENEGQFSISDLVWGKVKSHPWWPGQIFDSVDASEEAVKYFKKDSFLVAYFGDRTFAWNDASVLEPFRLHFNHIVKQSNSEVFQNAVSCALAEVSRRVELGLACCCIPKDVYSNIECQIVENTGIREESSKQYCKDKSFGATSFEPDKLVDYLRGLAQSPLGGTDQLNLVIARAQLLGFFRYKGCRPPPELVCSEEVDESNADLADNEIEDEQDLSSKSTSQKRKHNSEDCVQPKKKEKSMSELMGDVSYSPYNEDDSDGKALDQPVCSPSGRKRKAVDSLADGSEKRISIYAAKVSTIRTAFPKPSFKIGECIRKVASQLTGSASVKPNNDQLGNDVSPRGSLEFSSLDDMLLQLQSLAQNPRKGQKFLNSVIIFFSCFRNSVVPGSGPNPLDGRPDSGGRRITSEAIGGATEEFEFDDVDDSCWMDRTAEDYSEGQLLQNGENEGRQHQLVLASDPDGSLKSSRRSHSRRRYSNGNHQVGGEGLNKDIDRKLQLSSPAQLMVKFAEASVPSEMDLNKIFRRFGPLKESETQVDRESHHAKVVFKRGADAEVAYSSAGMFNIFGSIPVTYQLSYLPSSSFRALPLAISLAQEDTV